MPAAPKKTRQQPPRQRHCTRGGNRSCNSLDPIGYEGSEWNLYEYVSSNPLESTDPFGLQAFNVFACQAAALETERLVTCEALYFVLLFVRT